MSTEPQYDLPETAEEMRQILPKLSLPHKIKIVNHALLPYPYYDEVFDAIDECRRLTPLRNEPLCLFVSGETNSGKTTIAKNYRAKYPRVYLKEKTRISVLLVEIKSPPTDSSLCDQVLVEICRSADLRGGKVARTSALEDQLKDVDAEVIIFDELQSFELNKRVETNGILANWIKDLIRNAHVTVILMGMPRAENLFSLSAQLSRRFTRRIRIRPFRYDSPEAQEKFSKMLGDAEYGMPIKYSFHLESLDIASRVYYACNGWIGFASDLIRGAVILGLERDVERLSMDLLAESFTKNIQEHFKWKKNPFKFRYFTPEQALELIDLENKKLQEKESKRQ